MVGPTCQGLVKQRIVAEKGTKRRPREGSDLHAFGRMGDMKGCIATATELWFEKPGFPSGPAARAPRKPVEETCPRWRLRSIRAAAAARAAGAVRRTPPVLSA